MLNLRKINGDDVVREYEELLHARGTPAVDKVLYCNKEGICQAWEDFQTGVVYDSRNLVLPVKPADTKAYVI